MVVTNPFQFKSLLQKVFKPQREGRFAQRERSTTWFYNLILKQIFTNPLVPLCKTILNHLLELVLYIKTRLFQ